jgi:hypothetical protein
MPAARFRPECAQPTGTTKDLREARALLDALE